MYLKMTAFPSCTAFLIVFNFIHTKTMYVSMNGIKCTSNVTHFITHKAPLSFSHLTKSALGNKYYAMWSPVELVMRVLPYQEEN